MLLKYLLFVADKKAGKFKEWLDVSSLIEVKPSGGVMEILSYMAYESVGQVGEYNYRFI